MRRSEVERGVAAVLAAPLIALTIVCGLLTLVTVQAAQGGHRVAEVTAAVPQLVRLQQTVQAERAASLAAVTGDRTAAAGLAGRRAATSLAVSGWTGTLDGLRTLAGTAGDAARSTDRITTALTRVRHLVDARRSGTGSADATGPALIRAGYDAVVEPAEALPAATALLAADGGPAAGLVRVTASLRAADAVAQLEVAADRMIATSGQSARSAAAARAALDELAGREAALADTLTALDAASGSSADPTLATNLARWKASVPVAAGRPATAWDAAARRTVHVLQDQALAAADDAAAASAGWQRSAMLRALGVILAALAVVVGALLHSRRLVTRIGTEAVRMEPVGPEPVGPEASAPAPDWARSTTEDIETSEPTAAIEPAGLPEPEKVGTPGRSPLQRPLSWRALVPSPRSGRPSRPAATGDTRGEKAPRS